ncbi:MAG: hypothetical protein ACXVJS_17120 [Acidimicrobiia bacterium]
MLRPIEDLPGHIATRTSWHSLAERVLAPARHAATGRIGLRPAVGGFGTPEFDGCTLTVAGTELVRRDDTRIDRHPITTLREAAAVAGVEVGADTGVFTATTPADPDRPLPVDPGAATTLASWFSFTAVALAAWRTERAADGSSDPQLWPEHFDLALDLGPDDARRANYGGSPGDAGHEAPYLYVGPWTANDDPFWNAGSFARLGVDALAGIEDPLAAALAFFRRGYVAAGGAG